MNFGYANKFNIISVAIRYLTVRLFVSNGYFTDTSYSNFRQYLSLYQTSLLLVVLLIFSSFWSSASSAATCSSTYNGDGRPNSLITYINQSYYASDGTVRLLCSGNLSFFFGRYNDALTDSATNRSGIIVYLP